MPLMSMRSGLARAALLAACVLAACDSGGNAAPPTLGTAPPTVSMPPTTTAPPTTAPPASTAPASLPPGTVELSPDGPWRRVDSAPGITQPGLTYELMEGLWVWLPTVEDLPNGVNWVLNEEDLPVIEAYLQARLVFYEATALDPIDLDHPGWVTWYSDTGEAYALVLTPRQARHEFFDLAEGVVLRPVVLGEDRSDQSAIVLDCMLDGSVWRLPDGSVGIGSTPGIVENGLGALMSLKDAAWKVDGVSSEPEACR